METSKLQLAFLEDTIKHFNSTNRGVNTGDRYMCSYYAGCAIDDVKKDRSVTDDEAMRILEYTLTGEGTYDTIWDAIYNGYEHICPPNDDETF